MFNIDLRSRALKVKLAAFDIDGVMTDGSMIYDENGLQYKTFNAKDGQGIAMLVKMGIKTAVITAKESGAVLKRAQDLGMTKVCQGVKNKLDVMKQLVSEFGIDMSETAYMGDDLPDISLLKETGLASCPNDAVSEVKSICHFVSSKRGGRGAVRELADLIYKTQTKNRS